MTVYSLDYSFPNLEPVHCSMPGSKGCFLTCIQISQEAGKVVWGHLRISRDKVVPVIRHLTEKQKKEQGISQPSFFSGSTELQ